MVFFIFRYDYGILNANALFVFSEKTYGSI